MKKFIIFTDGACRGNPGPASYGFIIYDKDLKVIKKEGKVIGIATNNIAEYTAVLRAMEFVKERLGGVKNDEVEIITDSLLIASQLSGKYKIKNEKLVLLYFQIKGLEKYFNKVSYRNVPRAENKIADMLANMALDGKI